MADEDDLLLFADFVDLSRKSRVFKDHVNPFVGFLVFDGFFILSTKIS